MEDAYFILEGCITVGRDLHLRFETRANKPPCFASRNRKQLWRQSPASFNGRFYRYSDIRCEPFPVQEPHPPIWVGGHSRAALRRAARHGDGWHPVGAVAASPLPPQEPHGFPLISIEQNNLSRAPGYRVRLQLVDICRTVDFEDALRREASKGEKPQSRCDGSRRFAGNSARESALGGMRRSLPGDTTDDERSSMGF